MTTHSEMIPHVTVEERAVIILTVPGVEVPHTYMQSADPAGLFSALVLMLVGALSDTAAPTSSIRLLARLVANGEDYRVSEDLLGVRVSVVSLSDLLRQALQI